MAIIKDPVLKIVKGDYRTRITSALIIAFIVYSLILVSIYGAGTYFNNYFIIELLAVTVIFFFVRFRLLSSTISFLKRVYIRIPLGILMWFIFFGGYMNLFKPIDPFYVLALILSSYLTYLIVRKPRNK